MHGERMMFFEFAVSLRLICRRRVAFTRFWKALQRERSVNADREALTTRTCQSRLPSLAHHHRQFTHSLSLTRANFGVSLNAKICTLPNN